MKLGYIDGNNNTYAIDGNRIAYEPIMPAQSSSGTYSGGEPKIAALLPPELEAIIGLMERIAADTASHLAARPKGCGTIVFDEHRVCFQSPLKAELEQLLKAALAIQPGA